METTYLITEEVFDSLYTRFWRQIFRYAYHHCNEVHAAEEITQEVFLSIWQRREEIGPINDDFERYLMRAARLKVFDYHRSVAAQKKHLEQSSFALQEAGNCTEDALLYNELLQQVDQLLLQLPNKSREVYQLTTQKGLGKKQIACLLSLSEKTVEHYLYNATLHLRSNLER